MLRFHIVTWADRRAYQAELESYFRLRHDIYVSERKWLDIERPIPMEIDAFDTAEAIYLIGIDGEGEVCGGSRLVPTTRPHLLSEIFPTLTNGEPPRGSKIFEWSRFFVAPKLRTVGEASPAAGQVLCALLETCTAIGAEQLTVVCETFWLERLRRLGWEIRQLGKTLDHPDGAILALLIQVRPEILSKTRGAYGFNDAALLTAN